MEKVIKQVRQASFTLAALSAEQKNQALQVYAEVLAERTSFLLAENQKDLSS